MEDKLVFQYSLLKTLPESANQQLIGVNAKQQQLGASLRLLMGLDVIKWKH